MARTGTPQGAAPAQPKKAQQQQTRKRSLGHFKGRGSESAPPSSKRAKQDPRPGSRQLRPESAKEADDEGSLEATSASARSTLPEDLTSSHDVTAMNIISSSHIQQKATRAIEALASYPAVPPAKPGLVVLHAKAPVASKMITIAEITKREIGKSGGKWFQYNKIEQVVVEQKDRPEKTSDEATGVGKPLADADEEGADSGEEDTAFETMKTPFERANEGRPKVRAVPIMTIYLARDRIDSLRKAYG